MKFKKNESGRSMVEMLGVLAIIGVLSVGGIAGYSLSMRRHRANQVVDSMSKYAVIVYSHCQQQYSNGEITTFGGCYRYPNFEDAGIGNVPTGISSIIVSSTASYESTGIDAVEIGIAFSDQKLCQAVASTVGTTCTVYAENDYVRMTVKLN